MPLDHIIKVNLRQINI